MGIFTSHRLRRSREPSAASASGNNKPQPTTPDAGKKSSKFFFFRNKKVATKTQPTKEHDWTDRASIDSNIVRNLEHELDTLIHSYFSRSGGEDESVNTMDMYSLSSDTISECGSYDSLYGEDGNQCAACTDFRQLFCGGE